MANDSSVLANTHTHTRQEGVHETEGKVRVWKEGELRILPHNSKDQQAWR